MWAVFALTDAALLPFVYAGGVAQSVLHSPVGGDSHIPTAATITPLSLDALATEQYTTLKHPAFPRHQVRIKKSGFCDGSVQYVARDVMGVLS